MSISLIELIETYDNFDLSELNWTIDRAELLLKELKTGELITLDDDFGICSNLHYAPPLLLETIWCNWVNFSGVPKYGK